MICSNETFHNIGNSDLGIKLSFGVTEPVNKNQFISVILKNLDKYLHFLEFYHSGDSRTSSRYVLSEFSFLLAILSNITECLDQKTTNNVTYSLVS